MKRAAICFMLFVATLPVRAQKGEKTSGSAEKVVANLERQWVAAVKAGNFDFVAPLLADNFIEMDSNGSMHDKAGYLGWIKGSKWEVNEISHLKVTAFGNTVIATGEWRGKGVTGSGTSVDAHERYVDTWIKLPSGKWQCAANANAPDKH